MAKTYITNETFNDPKTGTPINYERLCISGSISGQPHTLKLKLEPTELSLAKILLSSNEELSVGSRPITPEEEDGFFTKNQRKNSDDDKIDLDDDD